MWALLLPVMGNNPSTNRGPTILTREELLERYRDDIPKDIGSLLEQVIGKLDKIKSNLNDVEGELINIRAQQQACTGILEHKEDVIERNKGMAEEAGGLVRGEMGHVHSDTTKKHLESVAALLEGCSEGVERDMEHVEEEVQSLEKSAAKQERTIEHLKERLHKLEDAKEMLDGDMNDEVRMALLELREGGVLDFGYNINYLIEEYKACKGVERVFDIDKVMEQPLVDVGQGIMMSEPVNVDLKLKMGIFAV